MTVNSPATRISPTAKSISPVPGSKFLLQPKLEINQPGDRYEQEADAMAEKVTHMSSAKTFIKPATGLIGSSLQRKCAQCEEDEKKKKPLMREAENSNYGLIASPSLASSLNNNAGGGSPLPQATKSFMEDAFSADFSGVRVHTDSKASEMSKGIHAKAFTYGSDIYFNNDQFAPASTNGKWLLAHELAHVIQQEGTNSIVQRAEVDDNPSFCFPTDGSQQLEDISYLLNDWIATAQANGKQNDLDGPAALVNELAALHDSLTTVVEYRIANLAPSQVRHVTLEESRYNVRPELVSLYHRVYHKSPVSPVINLCGVCVGADKIGHFFQQGGEYFRIGEALRKRIESWTLSERRALLAELQPHGGDSSPIDANVENLIKIYTDEYGKWLEGFPNSLSREEVAWIKSNEANAKNYRKGIYGLLSSGVLSAADLEANRQGARFFEDAKSNRGKLNICEYINENLNEYYNPNSYGGTGMFKLKSGGDDDIDFPQHGQAPQDFTTKIFFNTDSDIPGSSDMDALLFNFFGYSDILSKGEYHLTINGFASLSGDPEHNKDLSNRRANEVKSRLEFMLGQMLGNADFVFYPQNISIKAYGEEKASEDTSKRPNDDSQADRVVDVIFEVR